MHKVLFGLAALLGPAMAAAADAPKIDTGDTALVLVSAGLVLLMTPGLAFFYGGLVRAKNVVHTMLLSLICMGLVGVLWALAGYSIAFSPGGALNRVTGGLSWLGLRGVGADPAADLAATVPHSAFMLFQAMFAVITPALISGAIVERVRLKAYLLFVAGWSLLVYSPVAHWVWAPGGWLRELGALDFAGGTVVHINAAAAAVVFAVVLGKRRGLRSPSVLPHNVPFAILGAGLLWFGWLGFNGGSALGANGLASSAFVNTFFAPAAAALAWGLAELFFFHGKMSGVGVASGAVAGMVAITPAAGFVTPLASLLIGAAAGLASLLAVRLRPKLGLDDSLDVFAVHGVAATLGALLTGVLADKVVNSAGADGSLRLLGIQAVGVAATMAWSGLLSFGLLKAVALVTPLRADEQDEWSGMDMSEAGERAYITSDSGTSPTASPAHAEGAKALAPVVICALLALPGVAAATPSTTVWAPSTTYTQPYLVPHLTYDTYFRRDASYPVTTGLTMGVLPSELVQAEIGFDLLYPANDPLFLNGKLTLSEDKLFAMQPALSLGVANAGVTKATNFAMVYALAGKTIPVVGGSVAVGGYYGVDEKLWVDASGDEDRVGLLASVASPAIKVGQPFLDSVVLSADVQSGKNAFSAVGVAASLFFTPNISLLTGPVLFLERNVQPGRSDFMWTVQLDLDAPLRKAQ